ncbi:hypothetical protein ACC685_36205, partial [Rhizobium ruizarguesonis]
EIAGIGLFKHRHQAPVIDIGAHGEGGKAGKAGDLEEFHALYMGQGGPLPARVRALLDFLVSHVHF